MQNPQENMFISYANHLSYFYLRIDSIERYNKEEPV